MTVKFLDFNIEDNDSCDADYVEVYNGETEQDPLVGRYCGPVSTLYILRLSVNTEFYDKLLAKKIFRGAVATIKVKGAYLWYDGFSRYLLRALWKTSNLGLLEKLVLSYYLSNAPVIISYVLQTTITAGSPAFEVGWNWHLGRALYWMSKALWNVDLYIHNILFASSRYSQQTSLLQEEHCLLNLALMETLLVQDLEQLTQVNKQNHFTDFKLTLHTYKIYAHLKSKLSDYGANG